MNIMKFCAEEDGRYPLSETWVKDGWRYASDGRIAVREATKHADSEGKYGARNLAEVSVKVADFFSGHPRPELRHCLPTIPTHDGSGKDHTSPACEVGPEGDAVKCDKFGHCDATGDHDCTNKVKWRWLEAMKLGDYHYQGLYIDLINKELPGAKYAIDDVGMLYFYCGDIEGVLGCRNH